MRARATRKVPDPVKPTPIKSVAKNGHMEKARANVQAHVVEHDEETKLLCQLLFCGAAGRSYARTHHLARKYLEPLGRSVPSQTSIWEWAQREQWSVQAERIWKANASAMLVDTQFATVSAMHSAAQNFADSVAGLGNQSYEERAARAAEFKVAMAAGRDMPMFAKVTPTIHEDAIDAQMVDRETYEAEGRKLLRPGD